MLGLNEVFASFEAEGTVFGSINKQDFSLLKCIIPYKKIVGQFERLAYSLDQSIENNEKQSRTLTTIRDTLLPKLMSGEIRVKEAEKLLDAVV